MAALKIEGRLKRPEYVAAAVTAFRHALDKTASPVNADDLRQTFSRSGFTQGYFQDQRDSGMFGVRQREDIAPAETLRRMAALYAKSAARRPHCEAPRAAISFSFKGEIGQPVALTVQALGKRVCVTGDILERARTRELTESDLRRQLGRLGGTQYDVREIHIDLQAGAFMPLGGINALRRAALEALEDKVCEIDATKRAQTAKQKQLSSLRSWQLRYTVRCPLSTVLRFLSPAQIPENLPRNAQIFLPCGTPAEALDRFGAQVTIPGGVFGDGDKILRQLRQAKEGGASFAMAQTLDGVALARQAGLAPIAGEGMNILNSVGLEALRALRCAGAVLSAEITPAQARGLQAHIPAGATVYGRLGLMLCRNCPVKAQIGCRACGNGKGLVDRKGAVFPVRCEGACARVYNSRPLWLADVQDQLPPLGFRLFSFTVESREECAAVLRAYQNGEACGGIFTRGWMKS